MKDEERNKLEDVFFSKLHDIEVDTLPEDWDAIVDRLPGKAPVPLRRTLSYWIAAAVVSLLVVTGSLFLHDTTPEPVARKTALETTLKSETTPGTQSETGESETKPIASVAADYVRRVGQTKKEAAEKKIGEAEKINNDRPVFARFARKQPMEAKAEVKVETEIRTNADVETNAAVETKVKVETPADVETLAEVETQAALAGISDPYNRSLLADAAPASKQQASASSRKWGFGMGAGGLSVGADHVIPQYVTNSSVLRSENLEIMNATSFNGEELPKTDIHHKVPVSFGLSVSRYLNSRFSLQTGLSYSFLSSDWKTNGEYHGKTKQKLHFIGIPLSVSYKIAEWNRFNFYAAAGGMAEMNVAGKRKTQLFSDVKEINTVYERVRMKRWLWSVSARTGISYPIIRFVSAFAEVGASYYFDNGSSIETIHSEKPFNVSLQLGFRLGF